MAQQHFAPGCTSAVGHHGINSRAIGPWRYSPLSPRPSSALAHSSLVPCFSIPPNTLSGSAHSFCGVSYSATWPWSSTSTRSQSIMVCSRWAMVMTVQSWKFSRMTFWMSLSVVTSTEAVASSMKSSLDLRSTARARQISCAWPTDRLLPPSSTCIFKLSPPSTSCTLTYSARLDSSKARHKLSSLYVLVGSKLYRKVPLKSTGSCGMTHSRFRNSLRETLEMSIPSILMVPSIMSMRYNANSIEDLPLPVRPTKPIFSPGLISMLMPFSTSGVLVRYLAFKSLNWIAPAEGQSSGGAWYIAPASSLSILSNEDRRSAQAMATVAWM
mmetsp:Transcript_78961/g.131824  ORF Transcript_78961/g.131824 Transcript_78961/m.131824 type:complete len:327 (-) Transcript_78961:3356-4336(-)